MRAPRLCPSCRQIHGGPCPTRRVDEQQRKRRHDDHRGSAASRGYDSRWRKVRKQVLTEEPLCMCELHQGKRDAPVSVVVDHIIPHCGNEELFFRRSNLRGIAKACHDRKTARSDGGFGNPRRGNAINATRSTTTG